MAWFGVDDLWVNCRPDMVLHHLDCSFFAHRPALCQLLHHLEESSRVVLEKIVGDGEDTSWAGKIRAMVNLGDT